MASSRYGEASIDTARMFGEFYPNPGDSMAVVSMPLAMVAEGSARSCW